MNIRLKLTLRFAFIVASILIAFSAAIYLMSENYRQEEFFSRLESRALTTARLYVTVKEVDLDMLKIIDKNSIHALYQEKVLVFDPNNKLAYNSLGDFEVNVTPELLQRIRREKQIEYIDNGYEHVGLVYSDEPGDFVIISSAYDRYGLSKLENLLHLLVGGLLVGLGLIFIAGNIFAGQVLYPLARMNTDISTVTAGNLDQRIDEGNQRDEIAQLAINFNRMMQRLEAAFKIQQQFVSNASHELRTPLAAMSGQLQTSLDKTRSSEEYQRVLQSLLEDTNTLIQLTNGLLTLAQSGIDRQRTYFQPVRVDEALYAAQQELSKTQPTYHFQIEFDDLPDDEGALIVLGNETLLHTAFLNLMDNACKFSPDQSVGIRFSFPPHWVVIHFQDQGIGILPEEADKVFQPFFRGSNAVTTTKGYGIGLSLCLRIAQLHGGALRLESKPGTGSVFQLVLPLSQSPV